MSTYLVTFPELEKLSKVIDTFSIRPGVYWEVDEEFVVEVPSISTQGTYMGVTWRCEVKKADIVSLLAERVHVPAEQEEVIALFERLFLSCYTKVLGKHVDKEVEENAKLYGITQRGAVDIQNGSNGY